MKNLAKIICKESFYLVKSPFAIGIRQAAFWRL